TCAHRTPYRIPVLLRRAVEVLASQVATQLVALESIVRLRRELDVRERRRILLIPISGAPDPLSALLNGSERLLDVVPADGAIVQIDGISKSIGTVPHGDRARLLEAVGAEPISTDALSASHPALAPLLPGVAGLLVAPIPGHGVALFFRSEVTQVVRWLGDQSDSNRDSVLSPRRSFSAWSQSVSGTSLPWGPVVDEARLFGVEIADALDRRAESRLAELAHIDPLTGLRNRRAFLDVLEKLAAEGRTGGILFLDLDRFKEVNDAYGHEAGDVVLRAVAARVLAVVRDTDAVARLGGDEFVVLCPDLDPEDQTRTAERIVDAISEPIDVAPGQTIVVTASCGVATVDPDHTPSAVLESADAAMYRAKHAGRGRASR
ncbi:MAG: sensor domain-containing diguanylate cyclase, partial [Microbacterium sp.]